MVEQLYAIRYGIRINKEGDDFPFLFYLAYLKRKVVLIDTGSSSSEQAKSMGITLIPIEKELQEALHDRKISDILITHSHWDHIDNIYKYTDAQIYMAEDTYQKAMAEDSEHVRAYLQYAKDTDRVTFLNSDTKIMDTFLYERVGGHTVDSGVYYFEAEGKKYCITGDECFSIDHLRHNIPIDNAYNLINNIAFTERCYKQKVIPLPFHDNSILDGKLKITPNIVRVL